jgi:pyruvate dehydrogenase E1 component alpha subunit
MVFEAARTAIERARGGEGPTLLECMSYRITGHSRRDPCNYQPEEERKEALKNEPIRRFAEFLLTGGFIEQAGLDGIRADVDAEIERAVESAMAAPDPKPEAALEDVFV